MARTKTLKQEMDAPTTEQTLVEEGKVAQLPQTEPVDVVFIAPVLRDSLLTYLKAKPFDEVSNFINSLSQSPTGKVNVTRN